MHLNRKYSIGFEKIGIDIDKVRNKTTTCPKCSDSRKKRNVRCLSVNLDTGHYTCHHCDFRGRVDSNEWLMKQQDKQEAETQLQVTDFERKAIAKHSQKQMKPFITSPINDQGFKYLDSRGISENTAKAAKIAQKGQTLVFNYYLGGRIVNAKYRAIGEKKMWQHGEAPKRVLWGIDNVKGCDRVIICEGEMDALSFYEIGETCAVSVSQGAPNTGSNVGTKLRCLDNCAEQLRDKKEIIIAVDNDANGVYLESILVSRFGPSKCKVVKYPQGCKDANDVLSKFGPDRLKECLVKAEPVPIDGVITVGSVRQKMRNIKKHGVQKGLDIGIPVLADHFSFYKGWWNLYTGIPNSGKSEYVMYIMLCMSVRYGWKWAVFSPEHWPAEDFYLDVVEKFNGNRLTFIDDIDFELSMDFVEEHFFFVYHGEDEDETKTDEQRGYKKQKENTRANIMQSIKELCFSRGIDGFLIDPYNQMVKDSSDPRGERTDQELERALGQVDRLCKTHNLCGNVVAHPRTMYKDNNEMDYKCPTAYQISGGAMWYNKAYTITSVHRPFNQSNKDDKSVIIDVQKVKSHKRAGRPASVNMKFSHGWYIGEFEDREQASLYGAFEKYKASINEGEQSEFSYDPPESYEHLECPF